MKLKKLKISNFKAYKSEEFDFDKTSIIVGKNDAGKSSILHALDLFFNPKEANKNDIFHKSGDVIENEITIECHFEISDDISITIGDETIATNLKDSNLLKDGYLVLGKKYTESSFKPKGTTEEYIKCYNYSISGFDWNAGKSILEEMKQRDLNNAVTKLNLDKTDVTNHSKRTLLIEYLVSQNCNKAEIILSSKDVFDRLKPVLDKLPKFKLFSNDKQNSLNEKENKGVIEKEIKAIISEKMQDKITEITSKMQNEMQKTIKSLNDTYKELFSFLGEDDFKLNDGKPEIKFETNGITDKKGLNIENRGSGFRRLALLSLHLSSHKDEEYNDIIFAIEEPETSQNPHNQKGIIEAMRRLIGKGSQVIITTHSPAMAKEFSDENVQYIVIENDGQESKAIKFQNERELFKEIIRILGILPIDITGKKLIVFVEGDDEQILLKKINDDIIKDDEILFISGGGGGSIKYHIALNYFETLKMMTLVDKPQKTTENWRVSIQNELSSKYPRFDVKDFFITSDKEDITLYYKLAIEEPFYYENDGPTIYKLDKLGNKVEKLQYHKGDYNKERKGSVSKIFKSELLNNEISLTESHFYDFHEIKGWFDKFQNWKQTDLTAKALESEGLFNKAV